MFRHLLLAAGLLVAGSASAQLGKIPVAVTAAFTKQYTNAAQVSYEDNLKDYRVSFRVDTSDYVAHYSSKGEWRGTEKTIPFADLSNDVKDGFLKSKFSDWQVVSVLHLFLPDSQGGGEQFRVKVKQGEFKKRYLFFNRAGKLVRDKMTL
ncbi:hypothetical protein [Flaviaesturariibacter amylovorans]|uniref:Beta-lactamase-inhibitor-like PepSY-like domain-containing protein n=1 Tax=Flaviaesturariibacter amylovorans TaxID=1084520 RepID=A0ABP8HC50_9BACT